MLKSSLPFVSALLVTRNENTYIEKAMLSLIHQTYPKEKYEIIVIDGGSTDGTVEHVERMISQYGSDSFSIRIIPNEKRILASGWNIGIQNARGEYVIRIDAHAEAAEDFLERSVETILKTDAACVGGKLITKSLENDDPAVSKVLSSPFGVGNSSFRVSNTARYADTAVYGLYKKSIFEEVGFFNESFVRNQDIELHARIKKAGYKFYFDPAISCIYYSRNSVKKMMTQAYGNGKWNMVLLKKRTGALSLRHMVPFAFVLFLTFSMIVGNVWKPAWWIMLAVVAFYLLLGTAAAYKTGSRKSEVIRMPFLFFLLHISYGIGYISGLFMKTI